MKLLIARAKSAARAPARMLQTFKAANSILASMLKGDFALTITLRPTPVPDQAIDLIEGPSKE